MKNIELFTNRGQYAGLHEIDFDIKPNDIVVDIGGGNKPYPKATHIIDLSNNDAQRYNSPLKTNGKIFIDGDAGVVLEQFEDKYFDFCFSSHTFEHIENLEKTLRLIGKKCKRGFYAVPASDMEFFSTHEFFGHINICRQIGDVLHFTRRPPNTVIEELAVEFDKFLDNPKVHPIIQGHKGNRGYRFLWEARHYWEKKIKYKYYEDPGDLYPQLRFFL